MPETSATLQAFLQPGGKTDQKKRIRLNNYLCEMGFTFDVTLITTNPSSKYMGIRQKLIQSARSKGEKL